MAAANGMRDACSRWPDPAVPPPPEPGPLPDVPVLLLAGQHDVLTPRAEAVREAGRSSRAELVIVPGAGHSVLTGRNECARAAVRRFVRGRPAAAPCRRSQARLPVRLRGPYPQRLRDVPRVGVPGRGGLALAVALATLEDAQGHADERGRVGGLHGGSVAFSRDGTSVRLRAARYVPGVAVSGTLTARSWRFAVRGRGLVARLTVEPEGAVHGVADGRPFAHPAP
jgi:hypothetical protein